MKYISMLSVIFGILLIGTAVSAADLKRGREAYEQDDYKKALTEFKVLADQGDAVAQFYLCEMRLHGKGVTQDFTQAASLCEKAAQAGISEAQTTLAGLKMLGLGTKRDYQDGYFWTIISAIWSKDKLRSDSMDALANVSRMIGPKDKADIAGDAVRAWRR